MILDVFQCSQLFSDVLSRVLTRQGPRLTLKKSRPTSISKWVGAPDQVTGGGEGGEGGEGEEGEEGGNVKYDVNVWVDEDGML